MTVAKGIAGGFPLSAVVGKAEIMDAPLPGGLGGTYAGSPIGCSAALAVIDIIAGENLVERANQIGALFARRLSQLQMKYPEVIGDVRANRGAMVAMELVKNGDADQPDAELTKKLVTKAWQSGLILLSCGTRGNVIRFLPALTISDELLNEGIDIVERCLSGLLK
jgi:4-aminobutyrate aminotransferase/(S)-3-amino-2-methylpropionate transaminase